MTTLKRDLGLLDVFCIAAGSMISSGLFILPGIAFAIAGPAVALSYAIAGILMIPTMLSKVELGTAMPKSGGSYFFIERSLGPLVGTVAGLANWISIALKTSFALVGLGVLGVLMMPNCGELSIKLIAIAGCIFFSIVNTVSVKSTGRLQIVMVFGLLAFMVLYIAMGIGSLDHDKYIPFNPSGFQSIFAVAGMVFVSFGGLTKVVSVSEEIRNPDKTLAAGMFLAFSTINLLYVFVILVTVGTVDSAALNGSLTPITLGAKANMGNIGAILADIGALLAFSTTANAGILSASRSPMAMSFDGLLPSFFSKTNKRFKTPHISIIFTSVFIIISIAFLSIEALIKTASTMMIFMFMLVNVAVIIMRESGFQSYRPSFRTPFYPWLQIAAISTYAFLIFEMGKVPLIITGMFVVLACIWYVGYVHRRIDRKSALVFLVKSIVSKDIQRSGLEEELRQISLERDGFVLDHFDILVKECPILDIKTSISAKELFKCSSIELSKKLNIDKDRLYRKFIERERQSSTVVQVGLAIPHIVVDEKDIFEILLVRAKEGVTFSELHPTVKTAFILVGSLNKRNYHLRSLMAIANLLQEPEFEKRWFKAQNNEQLRDVVLLSRRKRSIK